jgi:hypothetical protein
MVAEELRDQPAVSRARLLIQLGFRGLTVGEAVAVLAHGVAQGLLVESVCAKNARMVIQATGRRPVSGTMPRVLPNQEESLAGPLPGKTRAG